MRLHPICILIRLWHLLILQLLLRLAPSSISHLQEPPPLLRVLWQLLLLSCCSINILQAQCTPTQGHVSTLLARCCALARQPDTNLTFDKALLSAMQQEQCQVFVLGSWLDGCFRIPFLCSQRRRKPANRLLIIPCCLMVTQAVARVQACTTQHNTIRYNTRRRG